MAKVNTFFGGALIDFIVRKRVKLTLAIFAVVLAYDFYLGFSVRPYSPYADPVGTLGVILALFGAFMRSWAAGVIVKGSKLATEGPYSLTRHPLYVGSFFIAVGFCTLFGSAHDFIALIGVVLILYIPRVLHEEKRSAQYFGDEWARYKEKTWLFLPKQVPERLFGVWRFSQWKHNGEYRGFFITICALIALKIFAVYGLRAIYG